MNLNEALKAIKEECEKHNRCKQCPLRTYDGGSCCVTTKTPENWSIASEVVEEVPRLFE